MRLSKAIDIAVETFKECHPKQFSEDNISHTIKTYLEWKEMALNPEPAFRKIASLKYLVESVFTFFHESSDPCTTYFWERIKQNNLGYQRENKLEKILKRGEIRGRIEFEYATDMLVVAEQEGLITQEESVRLSELIGQYENRK